MEITRQQIGDVTTLSVAGRLDGYWADHLDREVKEQVRAGARNLRLDCSAVAFLSSAGVRVMIRCARELKGIGGSFGVTAPSEATRQVLELSGLLGQLGGEGAPAAAHPVPADRTEERDGCTLRVRRLTAGAVGGQLLGDPGALNGPGTPAAAGSLRVGAGMTAVGLGALGEAGEGLLFGEFLAAGGAAVHLPTGPAGAPDYLLAAGEYVPPVQAVYAIGAEGAPALSISFEPAAGGEPGLRLGSLASAALDACGVGAAAMALVAETSGLVGASLKLAPGSEGLFAFPAVRERIRFTPDRAWPRSLALVAGVAARGAEGVAAAFLRPLDDGEELLGHFHAAAFPYRALPANMGSLVEAVARLFEPGGPQGVLHLLRDDRGISGGGESEFLRGTAWVTPLTGFGGEGAAR